MDFETQKLTIGWFQGSHPDKVAEHHMHGGAFRRHAWAEIFHLIFFMAIRIMRNWIKKILPHSGAETKSPEDNAATTTPAHTTYVDQLIAAARGEFARHAFDNAHLRCRSILESDPGNMDALLLAADIAFQRGVFDEAVTWLRRGVDLNPESADLHYKLGGLLGDTGNYAAAVEAYSAALRINPSFAKACNNMGSMLQALGRMDEALVAYKRAHELDPALWNASYNIGMFYKLHGQLEKSIKPFQQSMFAKRGIGRHSNFESGSTRSKLVHDIEQIGYLIDRGILGDQGRNAVVALKHALASMPANCSNDYLTEFASDVKLQIHQHFNRSLNFYNAPSLPGGALNPNVDWSRVEADYFNNAPGMTYADNFLTPEALASLRRFCLESTVWFDYLYSGGYVGCSFEDGFACPLLAQIAEEQRLVLPGIFGENKITGLWGYKYDSEQTGISAHADFAAVNVNFWLAPDDANLDPGSGGLVVWDKEAPAHWNFNEYNNDPARIDKFLASSKAKPFVVPHRQNRVVLFNSDLFHKTDSYRFKPGYENRRINVTMLYGYRQASDGPLDMATELTSI